MDTSNQPSDELIRELYARFGLAYYHSECLHRGLCIILALSGLPRRDLITRPRVEERLSYAFSLTLGDVACKLAGVLPEEQAIGLEAVVKKRNFLAHHFWFDRAHLLFRIDDVNSLIAELNGYSELFSCLDENISRWFEVKQRELGITPSVLQESMARILSGQAEESLPDKETLKELERKLKRKQRLVRVWEFTLPEGGKPLIFETEDGSLWQLCDVGLGWTRFQQVKSDWVEQPAITPYLPADILSRPNEAKPWEYEFRLRNGAVLWVKPGRHQSTFQWGVVTKRQDTDKPKSNNTNAKSTKWFISYII